MSRGGLLYRLGTTKHVRSADCIPHLEHLSTLGAWPFSSAGNGCACTLLASQTVGAEARLDHPERDVRRSGRPKRGYSMPIRLICCDGTLNSGGFSRKLHRPFQRSAPAFPSTG